MTDVPFILDDFLPYRLAVLGDTVSSEFSKGYRERFGIGRAEWRVMAHLSQTDSVSVREIHNKVYMDKSRVSRAAARLEKEGYIAKYTNPSDKRLVTLTLTDKGHEMVAELSPLVLGFQAELIRRLGPNAEGFLAGLKMLSSYTDLDDET